MSADWHETLQCPLGDASTVLLTSRRLLDWFPGVQRDGSRLVIATRNRSDVVLTIRSAEWMMAQAAVVVSGVCFGHCFEGHFTLRSVLARTSPTFSSGTEVWIHVGCENGRAGLKLLEALGPRIDAALAHIRSEFDVSA